MPTFESALSDILRSIGAWIYIVILISLIIYIIHEIKQGRKEKDADL